MSSDSELPPTVGTLQQYSENPFERRLEWAQEGDVVQVSAPDTKQFMLFHPDDIETVLFGEEDKYTKFEGFDEVFGGGVVSASGDQWRAQRGTLQSSFRPDRVRAYAETIRDLTADAVAELPETGVVDVRDKMTDLTLRVMLETLFDEQDDDGRIAAGADAITDWFLEESTAGPVSDDVQQRYETGREQLVNRIEEMIAERETGEGDDMLSALLAAGPDSEAGYTDERIRDEMITMLFAAHETTALTLTYTLFLLADHGRVARAIREEVTAVVGDAKPGPEHLEALDYTEQVIDEALRLYPPSHTIFRRTRQPVTIRSWSLPEGALLYLPQWVVHRDERWWDEPEAFRPERFGEEAGRPSFAFFPFGAGPRRCLGETFARAEAKLVVAALLRAYDLDRVTESFGLRASLTAVPDGPVELSFTQR
ncbi:cytochrome P450 [Halobaculum sp. MBLA0143]|uniref:cytochrome P450 n=1 Tax=Halobaculum sp. MBLA0143 TaxID=3079933 RepID=UPI003526AA18